MAVSTLLFIIMREGRTPRGEDTYTFGLKPSYPHCKSCPHLNGRRSSPSQRDEMMSSPRVIRTSSLSRKLGLAQYKARARKQTIWEWSGVKEGGRQGELLPSNQQAWQVLWGDVEFIQLFLFLCSTHVKASAALIQRHLCLKAEE